jgi:hypothetical protein
VDVCGHGRLYLGFDAPDIVDVVPDPGDGCAVRYRTYRKNRLGGHVPLQNLQNLFFRGSPAHIRYALDLCPPFVLHLTV